MGVATLGSAGLWAAGLSGVLLTALYTFRMVFLMFFGEAQTQVTQAAGLADAAPAGRAGGALDRRRAGTAALVRAVPRIALPALAEVRAAGRSRETAFESSRRGWRSLLRARALAYLLFLRKTGACAAGRGRQPCGRALHRFWFAGWGFDWLYDRSFVRPFVWIARVNKDDFIDCILRRAGVAQAALSWRAPQSHRNGHVALVRRRASPPGRSCLRWRLWCSYDPALAHR